MKRKTAVKTLLAVGAGAMAPAAANAGPSNRARVNRRSVRDDLPVIQAMYGVAPMLLAKAVPNFTSPADVAEAKATSALIAEALKTVDSPLGRFFARREGISEEQIERVRAGLEELDEALANLDDRPDPPQDPAPNPNPGN